MTIVTTEGAAPKDPPPGQRLWAHVCKRRTWTYLDVRCAACPVCGARRPAGSGDEILGQKHPKKMQLFASFFLCPDHVARDAGTDD